MTETDNVEVVVKKQPSLLADIAYLLIKIFIILALFGLLFSFVFGIHRVSEISMSPNIKDGDLVAFYRLDKNYSAGDSIALTVDKEVQVRRVVAVAGDKVDITKDGLMVNGFLQKGLDDESIIGETLIFEEGVTLPLTVPVGSVFVLGDNREKSEDSRIYGPVKIDDTLGKLMFDLRRRNL